MDNKQTDLTIDVADREHRHYIVKWQTGTLSGVPFVRIDDLDGGPYSNGASLTAEEAVQLLTWLERERPRLQEALYPKP